MAEVISRLKGIRDSREIVDRVKVNVKYYGFKLEDVLTPKSVNILRVGSHVWTTTAAKPLGKPGNFKVHTFCARTSLNNK